VLKIEPEICHVDRCPHGCTRSTGCQGIEWKLNHAERNLRDRGADLIADGWKWGFAVSVEVKRAGKEGVE
jgi:hypothetical protein